MLCISKNSLNESNAKKNKDLNVKKYKTWQYLNEEMESLDQWQVTYSPVDTFISCVKCLNVHVFNN